MTTRSGITRKAASRASSPNGLSMAKEEALQKTVAASSATDDQDVSSSVPGGSTESLLDSLSSVPGAFSETF